MPREAIQARMDWNAGQIEIKMIQVSQARGGLVVIGGPLVPVCYTGINHESTNQHDHFGRT